MPVSTSEWIASDSIAELPEKYAAMNFVIAIARFAAMAAKIATFDSPVMPHTITNRLAATEPGAAASGITTQFS